MNREPNSSARTTTRDRCLVAEPVGPPGSGKSTLVRSLLKRDDGMLPGIRLRRMEKVRSFLGLAGLLGYLLPRMARDRTWFTKDDIRCMVYLDAWHRRLTNIGPRDAIVLLDHGPIFRLAKLSAFGPPATRTRLFQRWWKARLVEWAQVLDVVVQLDAPCEVLLRRIRERRTYHILKDRPEEHGRSVLARFRKTYDGILRQVADCGRTRVLRFNTAESATDVIEKTMLTVLRPDRGSVQRFPPEGSDGSFVDVFQEST